MSDILKNRDKQMKILIGLIPAALTFLAVLYALSMDGPLHLSDSLPGPDWAAALFAAVMVKLYSWVMKKDSKNYSARSVEYGSARWGSHADIKPFIDPNPDNNIILTTTESLTMNPRPKAWEYARNKNIIVVGGSGAGKTRGYMKPNLMQCQSEDFPVSFIVTDPKGGLLTECGKMLQKNNYEIKTLNLIDFSKSMKYNPFNYVKSEKDILTLVNVLITNTKKGGKGGDDFWVQAETLLYCALIGYIFYEAIPEQRNMNTLVFLINNMETREDDEEYQNAVDLLFEELEKGNPDEHRAPQPEHFAVRQYKKYKLAAGVISYERLINQKSVNTD